jgi:hypothetical protein
MGGDDEIHIASAQAFDNLLLLDRRAETAEHLD